MNGVRGETAGMVPLYLGRGCSVPSRCAVLRLTVGFLKEVGRPGFRPSVKRGQRISRFNR
jgi:hypothetical protein